MATRRSKRGKKPSARGRLLVGVFLMLVVGVVVWWIWKPPGAEPGSGRPSAGTDAAGGGRGLVSGTNGGVPPTVRTSLPPVTPRVATGSNLPPAVAEWEPEPKFWERPATNFLEAQVALARLGFSSGSIDGRSGYQTRAALRAYQAREGLPITGELDAATQGRLRLRESPLRRYTVTAADMARLHPVPSTWLGKSQLSRLDYETILELVAERGWAHPDLVRRLNPGVNWTNAGPGTVVVIPRVAPPAFGGKAAFVRISLSARVLRAYDSATNMLFHCPCSIARAVDKRPVGELRVKAAVPNPDYRFDPAVFPESAEGRRLGRRLMIPAGPNNPVGVAWIGLDRPGYGIHGTPRPEDVGRTESHGCFRLANWNAEQLLGLVWGGMPVYVEH